MDLGGRPVDRDLEQEERRIDETRLEAVAAGVEQVAGLDIRQGRGGPPIPIQLRCGLASFPGEGAEVPELLQLAGQRMRGETAAGNPSPA